MSQRSPNKSKQVQKTQDQAPNIPLWLPNIIDYLRFILLIASWRYALNDPQTFTILFSLSYLLDMIDGNIARLLNQTSHYGQQLDILFDRFATSTLLFVVLKLGLVHITDETEKMKYALFFSLIFLNDFISHWFLVYSNFLVGNKSHTENENSLIVKIYYSNQIVMGFICFLNEFYVFNYYMTYFPQDLQWIRSLSFFPLLQQISVYGCLYKNLVNLIQLYSSSMRIISLDVAQKNAKK